VKSTNEPKPGGQRRAPNTLREKTLEEYPGPYAEEKRSHRGIVKEVNEGRSLYPQMTQMDADGEGVRYLDTRGICGKNGPILRFAFPCCPICVHPRHLRTTLPSTVAVARWADERGAEL
jgi:hypothetical protein